MRALYGDAKLHTMKAKVAVMDGEPVGLAGYYMVGDAAFVFSTMTDAIKDRPMLIWREAKAFMDALKVPARCVADPNIPGSGRFLRRLGWTLAGTRDGVEVYEWLAR